jgi:NADPH2:quinone reductase
MRFRKPSRAVPAGLQTKQAAAVMPRNHSPLSRHVHLSAEGGDTALSTLAPAASLLLTQIARMRGARVISTVSTPRRLRRHVQPGG